MKKNLGSTRHSSAHTSPTTTPESYVDNNVGSVRNSWSSEHGPLSTSGHRRKHIGAAALLPYRSRKELPSKWDDAERWITSPISGQVYAKTPIARSQRQRKSKSGPLGLMYSSDHSASTLALDDGNPRTCVENLAFKMKSNSLYAECNVLRTANAPNVSVQSHGDDKVDNMSKEDVVVYRRDVATQMSPKCSSSKGSRSASNLSQDLCGAKVRDVQVDRRIDQFKKRQLEQHTKKNLDCVNNWSRVPPKELQTVEEKISAWENLQKAKAEASIQKLEMALEKTRSESMEKISNRLRAAQTKADGMRSGRIGAPTVHTFCGCLDVKTCSVRSCFVRRGK